MAQLSQITIALARFEKAIYIAHKGVEGNDIKVQNIDSEKIRNGGQFTSIKIDRFDEIRQPDRIRTDEDGSTS